MIKKKYLGQHFLNNQKIIAQIIEAVAPQPSDYFLEIGPGEGALTTKLLPLVHSINAIELDQDIIPALKKNCANSKNSNSLYIHQADILKFDFTQFSPLFRLVGNLPYNISTPILFKAIENISLIKNMYFMLQKEVAERITAPPGSKTYGRLSVMLQYYCETELLLYVPPGAFSPPPKINSAFIKLTPRNIYKIVAQDKNLFSEIVRSAFCKRRKIISNSLKKYITAVQLKTININPTLRPEQLGVDEFVSISNAII